MGRYVIEYYKTCKKVKLLKEKLLLLLFLFEDIMRKIIKQIDKALLSSVTVFIGIVSAFLYYIIPVTTRIPIWGLILCIWVFYLLVVIIYCIFKSKSQTQINILPKVLAAHLARGKRIFILQQSELYNYDCYVSVYFLQST